MCIYYNLNDVIMIVVVGSLLILKWKHTKSLPNIVTIVPSSGSS
jgi:hypothetical protein